MKKTLKILSLPLALLALQVTAQPAFADEGAHKHSPQQKSAERRGIHHHGTHEHEQSAHDHKAHQHDMGQEGDGAMQHDMGAMKEMFLVKKDVDGYVVSFHIMPVKEGMQHGGTHNLMIKVESDGAELSDIMINSKVFYADKSSESKMLMKMGSWYMAGYDLGKAGKHGVMVLFKTSDGKKHKTSIYYSKEK